ncbi:MAG: putative redox protein, regulator of disulfide bond formation [Firmicutes bacterium]|nr:putative redox protein, regulator of disulfide bond formation [Bacillota bacterium]
MSLPPVIVQMELVNQKIKFSGISKTNPDTPVAIDYVPPLGDGEGFLGLELLVMSFAGCVSTAIVGLLRRMNKNLSAYKMDVTGIKNEQPLSLQKIHFAVTIESNNINEDEIQNVLKMAEQISPVWIAIRNNVEVNWEYKIINH